MLENNSGIAAVYWVTGLSNAGKSTIAKALYDKLKQERSNVVLLDGDILRSVFDGDKDYRYESKDRLQIAYRNARLCKLLADQGITVICATISLFHEIHNWNRQNLPNYYEIFIHAPFKILQQRDCKGVYLEGSSNVVGLDIQPEYPIDPDLNIENLGDRSPTVIADMIHESLRISAEQKKENLHTSGVSCE